MRIAICSRLAILELGVFLCCLDSWILFSFRVSFSYSEEYTLKPERLYNFYAWKINQVFPCWMKDILKHRATKWALSNTIGSTNTRGLAHVNLMQKILSRVLVEPRKLNHLLLEVSLHCQTFTCSDPLEVCFPWLPHHHHLQRITSPFTLPLISGKGKRDLLNKEESCLSHVVSYKSEEVHLQALFCLFQTRNMNFNLLPLALSELCQRPTNTHLDSENPSPHLRTDHSSAAQCCHQLYCSHSKAFYPTRSFFLKVTALPKEATRHAPTKVSNLPHM